MKKIITTSQEQFDIPPELDRRMRMLANLLIDRILEDKKNGELKTFAKKDNLNIVNR